MTHKTQIRTAHPKDRLQRLWVYREAIFALVGRQFKARFDKPAIGLMWMLLQPAALAVLFAVFFGLLVRIPSNDIPYPVFVFVGVALWQGVARALGESAHVFESAASLLRQTSMPRLAPVFANVAGSSLDVLASLVVAVIIALAFGVIPGFNLVFLPVFLALALIATTGIAAALAGVCGAWRDVRQLIPLGLQFMMFASPVIYPSSLVPPQYQLLYAVNPYSGILDGLRWSMLHGPMPQFAPMFVSTISALACFVIGIWIFMKLEGRAADAL
ncbi:MAG: ABC transporter permease [Robiginitomaculum sp.]|nr:ABC transporter permease [Robiginitomaculum sp.]